MSNSMKEGLDLKNGFSKILKEIDTKFKFNQEVLHSENFKKEILLQKKLKRLKYIKNQQHENIVLGLKKLEDEAKKKLNIKLKETSLTSALNRLLSLPKISKYKKNIQVNKNDDDFKLIRFENIWREQYNNDLKYNKNKKKNKMMLGRINFTDIFDENYDKYRKTLEESKRKDMRIERVKINNLKVSKKLNAHRKLMLRFQEQRIYHPNYSVIEKHIPIVKLNSKSQRLFLKNMNSLTASNIKSYRSRNNKYQKNNQNKQTMSSLSVFNNDLIKNVFNKSKKSIIHDKTKYNKQKLSISMLNLKQEKYNISLNSNNNKNNSLTVQGNKMNHPNKINANTLDIYLNGLKLKI